MATLTTISQGITFYLREINLLDLVTNECDLQPRESYAQRVIDELLAKFRAGETAGIPPAYVFYIGVEFLSPDEFVESINGAPVAADA